MKHLQFLKWILLAGLLPVSLASGFFHDATAAEPVDDSSSFLGSAQGRNWLVRWEKNITGDSNNRYCDKEMGEQLGWLVSPFLNGFYYGYLATQDPKWVEHLIDWTDACIQRGIKEPDGFIGWLRRRYVFV